MFLCEILIILALLDLNEELHDSVVVCTVALQEKGQRTNFENQVICSSNFKNFYSVSWIIASNFNKISFATI